MTTQKTSEPNTSKTRSRKNKEEDDAGTRYAFLFLMGILAVGILYILVTLILLG